MIDPITLLTLIPAVLALKLTGSARLTRGFVSAGIFTALAARLALFERA